MKLYKACKTANMVHASLEKCNKYYYSHAILQFSVVWEEMDIRITNANCLLIACCCKDFCLLNSETWMLRAHLRPTSEPESQI